jgi:MFS family permease
MNVLAPLKRPRIASIWAGLLVSATGDQFYQIALVWLAAGLVGSEAGYLTAAQGFAVTVVGLLSGVLVDRWDNRRTMMAAEFIRLLALVSVPLLFLAGALAIWQLYLVAIVTAAARTFYQPALQASLPVLVPDAETRLATNGLLDGTRRFARILGAGMIGTVALLVPTEFFFVIAAATCLVPILAVAPLKAAFGHTPPALRTAKGLRGFGFEFVEVAHQIAGHRALMWSLVGSTLGNAAWNVVFVLGLVLYVQSVLPGEIGAYGYIMAAYGVGNVAATLVVGSIRRLPLETIMLASRIFYGGGIVLLALAPNVATLSLAAACASFGGPMNDIPFLALMQRHFAARQIGRVYAFRLVVDSIGLLAGSLISAAAFARWPVPTVIGTTGAIIVAYGFLALWRGAERDAIR